MTARTWQILAWLYHTMFFGAVTWPGQMLVNSPTPLVLGLPRQMAWISAWIIGSLVVLWRLSAAENREARAAKERA